MELMEGVVSELVGGIICGLLNPKGMMSMIKMMLSMIAGMMAPFMTGGGIRGLCGWCMPGGVCVFIYNYLCYGLRLGKQCIMEVICCK
ncbi:MAG: hypothetical protein MASP_00929 [Candidatus Methanolliviera sp. GoM_asphalt]|nr:MAG: hypothetical protein MASP_00929 [Candidatus Methanolliviera sp. GoM_asphalt]